MSNPLRLRIIITCHKENLMQMKDTQIGDIFRSGPINTVYFRHTEKKTRLHYIALRLTDLLLDVPAGTDGLFEGGEEVVVVTNLISLCKEIEE